MMSIYYYTDRNSQCGTLIRMQQELPACRQRPQKAHRQSPQGGNIPTWVLWQGLAPLDASKDVPGVD